jgi:hypothetical protein
MKKKLLHVLCAALPAFALAQVAVNKSAMSNASVSLEFSNNNKGLVLPWTTNTAGVLGQTNGSLVYDVSTKTVQLKLASGWMDLSQDENGTVDDSAQATRTSLPNAKVSIGTPTTTPGILVLEAKDKAMILPKVNNPHTTINQPPAGTMVYDTAKNMLCVYNGTNWTFWKP